MEQMVHLRKRALYLVLETEKEKREREGRGKDEGREEKLGQSSCPQADCSQVQGTAGTRLQVTEAECCWSLALDTRGDCKTFHLNFKSWADGKSVV